MKTQVWVYVVVAVLSLGAGVAIAGVPTFEERDPTIQPPTESTSTTTTIEAQLTDSPESTPEPESDAADDASDDVDNETPTTEGAVATTPTTSTTSTTSTTPTPTSTTTTTLPPVERDTLQVAVANGANVGGVASNGSNTLEEAGYVNVGSFDGTEIRDVTVVFAAGGFQSEAERLAEEIGVDVGLIFPIETAPGVESLDENVQLLVYLGRDVVNLPFFN